MGKSLRLAYCAMLTAVGTACLFLTGLIPVGTYALPALAGVPLISVVIEMGSGWAFSVYAAVSLLSLLVAPDKEAALLFLFLFGCYPILKSYFERAKRKSVAFLAKFVLFNAVGLLDFWAGLKFFGVSLSEYGRLAPVAPLVFLAAGNLFFWVYDYALSLLVVSYWKKLHPVLAKWLRS